VHGLPVPVVKFVPLDVTIQYLFKTHAITIYVRIIKSPIAYTQDNAYIAS